MNSNKVASELLSVAKEVLGETKTASVKWGEITFSGGIAKIKGVAKRDSITGPFKSDAAAISFITDQIKKDTGEALKGYTIGKYFVVDSVKISRWKVVSGKSKMGEKEGEFKAEYTADVEFRQIKKIPKIEELLHVLKATW